MRNQRFHRWSYRALRFFQWALFLVIIEIIFWYAGWMLFGLADMFAGVPVSLTDQTPDARNLHFFPPSGKVWGLIGGLFFTRFVMGRYFPSDRRCDE